MKDCAYIINTYMYREQYYEKAVAIESSELVLHSTYSRVTRKIISSKIVLFYFITHVIVSRVSFK